MTMNGQANLPIRLLKIFLLPSNTFSRRIYVYSCFLIFALKASFKHWFSLVFPPFLFRLMRANFARTANVAHGTYIPKKERSLGNSPNTNAEGAILSDLSMTLQAFLARLCKNHFLSFAWSFRDFGKCFL